jgi:hypothetical protein
MNKRVTFNKITRWVVFCLALLPFVLLVFYRVKIHFADSSSSSGEDLETLFVHGVSFMNNILVSAVDYLPWYLPLFNILFDSKFIVADSLSGIIYNYFNYLVLLSFLDLIFYAFTFFLSLIRSIVNKFGGDL